MDFPHRLFDQVCSLAVCVGMSGRRKARAVLDRILESEMLFERNPASHRLALPVRAWNEHHVLADNLSMTLSRLQYLHLQLLLASRKGEQVPS